MTEKTLHRCRWVDESDPIYVAYHDEEWGVPVHEDRMLFELLVLETFQAGLSWRTVLHKRENFRAALDGFDPVRVAAYDEAKLQALMADPGIIRRPPWSTPGYFWSSRPSGAALTPTSGLLQTDR